MSLPAKFGTYEVFRMILPGLFAIGLFSILAFLFPPTREAFIVFLEHPVFPYAIIMLGIFVGLLLYEYDHPKKTRFWKEQLKPQMPSLHLKKILCDKCVKPCEKKINSVSDAIDTYFYVLHKVIDPSSREKIFYHGSTYHVLADVRALSVSFGTAILVVSLFRYLWKNDLPLFETVFGLALGVILLALWIYLHPEFFCNKNLSKGDRYMRDILRFQRRYLDLHIEQIKQELCK